MRSDLFAQEHQEQQTTERWVLQSKRMLRVALGADVLAAKGAMVAFQGQVTFNHEGSGGLGIVGPVMATILGSSPALNHRGVPSRGRRREPVRQRGGRFGA